ncbi:aminotransferase class V-fold PLP-dependent enzyme [Bradyrhizobium pachyrhizi]|uniref:aminotransferase class V-fold PLP-dependent enzyme n=1 Tax=Bradyrhizobium pachyrhizi TaxID=280333 RepID=UPI001364B749|nr:aminotransferase class V-fold PLP-dependent enzyme [Bradyrhizobium pachyrhizi]
MEHAVLEQLRKSISIYDRSGIFLDFEERFRAHVGRKFALLTNSGTSALHSIYEGLDLRPGDELIVPAYTFYATISPLAQYGVFLNQVDADANGNVDPAKIEQYVTPRTRAIVVTHMWGHPCNTKTLLTVAARLGLPLIEDCSHAHGAADGNTMVGSLGHAAAWSLQGQKNVTGGEGGILVTDDETLFERALMLGHYNKRAKQQLSVTSRYRDFATTGLGLKLRAHPIAIAIADEQFSHLRDWTSRRQTVANQFIAALQPYSFIHLPNTAGTQPAWYAFVFHYDQGRAHVPIDRFVRALHAEGLVEVDQPSSTGLTAGYPLFTRTPEVLPRLYDSPMLLNASEPQPNAARFFQTAIKLPVWLFDDEMHWVSSYIAGLRKVCDVVANNPAAFG